MVDQKFWDASTLGQDHLSQRWRGFTILGPHNYFFRQKSCFLNNLSLDHNNITFAIFYNLPESLSAASPKNWFPNNIWFPADERDSGRMISSGDRSSKNTHFHSMCSVLKHFKTRNPPKILFIQYVQCWSSGSISKCEILKIWSQCFYQVLRHSKNATVLEIWLEQGIYTGGGEASDHNVWNYKLFWQSWFCQRPHWSFYVELIMINDRGL